MKNSKIDFFINYEKTALQIFFYGSKRLLALQNYIIYEALTGNMVASAVKKECGSSTKINQSISACADVL